jgi:uncharacterized protein YqkB
VGLSATGNGFDAEIEATMGPAGYFERWGVYSVRDAITIYRSKKKSFPKGVPFTLEYMRLI